MTVEILYFEGCPNHRAAADLVRELVVERGLEASVRTVRVESPTDVERTRFLGSPTVRVNGRDVEPSADERTDYVYACRVYRTPAGTSGIPDPRWISAALEKAAA